ncbi:uncharacterized protein LOC121390356 isoform X2 [Gigantopelta aegis]|uniref:uncharacterized protein LOC121390356 isoform X2 n=1 Tax=Gigantopelta aegis TaxID=1735272 RepID=UPI001B8886C3|nr:uncharacterized protein LOC121390356 isoform X2 [Gigantopelta aegis]
MFTFKSSLMFVCFSMAFQMMPASARTQTGCNKKSSDSCPKGHEMTKCKSEDGYYCKQCSEIAFQPNENRLGDRCRLRRACTQHYMEYKDYGSKIKNADCQCFKGYHFENEDQRACVPNRVCNKGYGQGLFGVCTYCLEKNMYSDVKDRFQKCKPLRNCEKEGRCTKTKSNGTFDNICGPPVRDINDCSSIIAPADDDKAVRAAYIAAGVVGALLIVVLIVMLLLYMRKRRFRRKYLERPLTPDQLEELKKKILEKCEKDNALCKKVLGEACPTIENRIDKQLWTLAQELFRSHYQAGKYEVLVEKYKEMSPKMAVRGYLGEWRTWKEDTYPSVCQLFQCLRYCKRDDITFEICNHLRGEVGDIVVDAEGNIIHGGEVHNRAQNSLFYGLPGMFSCLKKPQKSDPVKETGGDSTNKLLECQVRDQELTRVEASAPALDEHNGLLTDSDVSFHRQYSMPVQCTS